MGLQRLDLLRKRALLGLAEKIQEQCQQFVRGTLKVHKDRSGEILSPPTIGCSIIEERNTSFFPLFTRKEIVIFADFRIYAMHERNNRAFGTYLFFSSHLFSFNERIVEMVRASIIYYEEALRVDEMMFTHFDGWATPKQEIL